MVIGTYIPPSETDESTCNNIIDARNSCPHIPLILLGDINVNLDDGNNPSLRDIGIMACLATLGVDDMSKHFRRRRKYSSGYTWSMYRSGTRIFGKCDYILADERKRF
jgi:hypothetical protein